MGLIGRMSARPWILLLLASVFSVCAQDIDAAKKQLLAGKYEEAIKSAEAAIEERERDEEWRHVLLRAQMAVGKYPEALASVTNALRRFPLSIRVRLKAHEVYLANGRTNEATATLGEINDLGASRSWAYRDPENLVALGKGAVLLGADPKLVLANFFEPAKKADAKLRDVYLEAGELALEKQDYALAGKYFWQGVAVHPKDPDMHYGLARAFAPDNRKEMGKALEAALSANPRHAPALLVLIDHLIDAEQYDDARTELKKVDAINPNHPEAWAYKAVLAHLHSKHDEEKAARAKALEFHPTNPRVDHLIGTKLSQKYRFAEGAGFQRQAILWNPRYLPAKFQLANDLLRLGENDEGWALAEQVYNADGYNVGAYNLVTLKDTISKFHVITNDHFLIRMDGHEKQIYGDDVLGLLNRAHTNLTSKYNTTLAGPTTVEIFPQQKDFAIRTFGMPGGEGYLGVCFGRVITANSPASTASRNSNWEAMLWHEFCHVVTLQMTKNKMPRWLSEGISVYEERVANPTWGQSMNERYVELVGKGKLKPIDELSSAFLTPDDDLHLQFAYYQSSIVVEYIISKYGIGAIRNILHDLGEGIDINESIVKHTTAMEDLNKDFIAYAKSIAEGMAPKLNWEKPDYKPDGAADPIFVSLHPNNYYILSGQADKLMEEKKWEEAKKILRKIADEYPTQVGGDSATFRLALVHRELEETAEEEAALRRIASLDAEAFEAYMRLVEIDSERRNWTNALINVQRARAINPLTWQVNAAQFAALKNLERKHEAIKAGRKLLALNPPDAAGAHFQLAELLVSEDQNSARLHTLKALEEAPRFRDAQKLLLKVSMTNSPSGSN